MLSNLATQSTIMADISKRFAEADAAYIDRKYWKAVNLYQKILKKYPNHPRVPAVLNLVDMSMESEQRLKRQLGVQELPDNAKRSISLSNAAIMHYANGKLLDAIAVAREAIAVCPDYAYVQRNISAPLSEIMEHAEAVQYLKRATDLEPKNEDYFGEYIFLTDLTPGFSMKDSYEIRREYNKRFIEPILNKNPVYTNARTTDRKIRVGYVTADFFQHSAPFTFMPMIKSYDPATMEVYAYGRVLKEDNMTGEVKEAVTVYRDIKNLSTEAIVNIIRNDQIDVLVDLSGFTLGGNLAIFAQRPAPIQVSGWGYATGMSLDCFDWFFGDTTTILPEDEEFLTERTYLLPCILSWMPADYMLQMPVSTKDPELPFTFGILARQHKITKDFFQTVCTILEQTPISRLVIKTNASDLTQITTTMIDMLKERGVYYADEVDKDGKQQTRVVFAGKTGHTAHLLAHHAIDVLLDPFPHGNAVSAFESLWMGMPIITLYGERVSGRITASILNNMDLPELIASDKQQYIEKAIGYYHDPESARVIRRITRERLFDTIMMKHQAYAKAVENGYRFMLDDWIKRTTV